MATTPTPTRVDSSLLRPYGSFVVLECTGDDPAAAVRQLLTHINGWLVKPQRDATVIASGITRTETLVGDDRPLESLDGLIYRHPSVPGWSVADSPYTSTSYELLVIARRRRLLAVHGPGNVRDAILRWIDREPRPPLRRVPRTIIQGAFLQGEAKGLWLVGTHPRRTTKADSKNLSGRNLAEALNPIDDSTFALSSARATVPGNSAFVVIDAVGATPRNALVWTSRTDSFAHFVSVVQEVLDAIATTMATGAGVDHPYPLLAAEVDDLTGVSTAYEIGVAARHDIADPDADPDMIAAAEFLERALLDVRPGAVGSNFVMDVGIDGSHAGGVECTVRQVHDRVELSFGFSGNPTSGDAVRQVLDALRYTDLLSIHYLSGHYIQGGAIFEHRVRSVPFPKWIFEDFAGFDVTKEKCSNKPTEIHRDTGAASDDSLFSWIARRYTTGWLTCDDGSGEVADFVHLDPDGTLSLIHAKAATSSHPGRRVSATPYEVVVSQAVKNIQFLDAPTLVSRLATPLHNEHATWLDGVRQPNRRGFVDAVSRRVRTDPLQVIIVQPQLRKSHRDHINATGGTSAPEDAARLARLEMLLNSARGSITGAGADLLVIAST